ncbi:hypothetical protein HC028_15695 [Planosporangium flavigriseum]|uniref:Uncharacterized protein n=1 Tax=Planosporangium flavigriseum TaxID=373681 RepID=A0A8J3LXK3_9ACTN|nr:hypothetical protein [Planosporangium flavigriseum]NJC65934.1 hypothetical protein [Planosporangium flavigriseum]GIG75639.1 hypothetical protein Pfl04_40430 [Planosporangium flavigriseum]
MRPDDDSPAWLRDYKAINVDIDGLHSFAGAIEDEVEGNFRPHTTRLFSTYSGGVPFGPDNPSGEVHAAKLKYHDCLTSATEAMTAYINASKVLVAAIKEAAAKYADSDALAHASAQDVERILGQAILNAQTAAQPQPSPRGAVRAE